MYMKTLLAAVVCLTAIIISASCSTSPEEREKQAAQATADAFTESYFNYSFERSSGFCTDESIVWLRLAASNVTQEDVDLLNSQPEEATAEALDIDITSDTTALAVYRVSNFLLADTLGRPGRIVEHADFPITLVKRGGKWKVRMEGPLRSERQSRG